MEADLAGRAGRDLTVEEFNDWSNAKSEFAAVRKAADEEGGPHLSLVPLADQEIAWPTDLLAPSGPPDPDSAAVLAEPFDGVALPDSRKRLARGGAPIASACSSPPSPKPVRSISPAAPHALPRDRPIGCAPARPPSPPLGTARFSSRSADCRRSSSTAPSTAASNRCFAMAIWSASGAFRVTACSPGCSRGSIQNASLCRGSSAAIPIPRPTRSPPFPYCSTRSSTPRLNSRALPVTATIGTIRALAADNSLSLPDAPKRNRLLQRSFREQNRFNREI